MPQIMIDAAKNREWRACYSAARLRELYDRPMTFAEVASRKREAKDGEWSRVALRDLCWLAAAVLARTDRGLLNQWCSRVVKRAAAAAYAAAYAADDAAAADAAAAADERNKQIDDAVELLATVE